MDQNSPVDPSTSKSDQSNETPAATVESLDQVTLPSTQDGPFIINQSTRFLISTAKGLQTALDWKIKEEPYNHPLLNAKECVDTALRWLELDVRRKAEKVRQQTTAALQTAEVAAGLAEAAVIPGAPAVVTDRES